MVSTKRKRQLLGAALSLENVFKKTESPIMRKLLKEQVEARRAIAKWKW